MDLKELYALPEVQAEIAASNIGNHLNKALIGLYIENIPEVQERDSFEILKALYRLSTGDSFESKFKVLKSNKVEISSVDELIKKYQLDIKELKNHYPCLDRLEKSAVSWEDVSSKVAFSFRFGNSNVDTHQLNDIVNILVDYIKLVLNEDVDDIQALNVFRKQFQPINELTKNIRPNRIITILHPLRPNIFPLINGYPWSFIKSLLRKNKTYTVNTIEDYLEIKSQLEELLTEKNLKSETTFSDLDSAIHVNEILNNNRIYWLVGSAHGEVDKTQYFLDNSVWETSGYDDKLSKKINAMEVGEIVVIKSTYVRSKKDGLPFDNKGNDVSTLSIKALGVITNNPKNGATIEVDWQEKFDPVKEWYFSTYQQSISKLKRGENWKKDALIDFIVNNKKQDLEKFRNAPQWKNKFGNSDMLIQTDMQNHPLNQILYGPPGTGKTFKTRNKAYAIIKHLENDPEDLSNEEKKEYEEFCDNGQIKFVTFHQSYAYEDFIQGIKAKTVNNQITYQVESGVFKQLCEDAQENIEQNYVIIIDEINRGNISSIFGELITLIEPNKRLNGSDEVSVILPNSDDGSDVSASDTAFSVPPNLYIIGTMNTADRSLTQLDIALRRRFDFIEMMPNPSLLDTININDVEISLEKLLSTINQRIEFLLDRDHTIGHSYFMKVKTLKDLKNVFKNNVLPLLQEYFYEDWERIRMVLNNQFITVDPLSASTLFPQDQDNSLQDQIKYSIDSKAFKEIQNYKNIYQLNKPTIESTSGE